jgi:hypothetical protein
LKVNLRQIDSQPKRHWSVAYISKENLHLVKKKICIKNCDRDQGIIQGERDALWRKIVTEIRGSCGVGSVQPNSLLNISQAIIAFGGFTMISGHEYRGNCEEHNQEDVRRLVFFLQEKGRASKATYGGN